MKPLSFPDDSYGECIVEQGINFSGEVSLVGARAHDGSTVFYPLTHNLHQDGILRTSVAFPQANAKQQEQAEAMLSAIMHELGYVGVMAMECFITPEGLLINELAPRVHNSGTGRKTAPASASLSCICARSPACRYRHRSWTARP
ncbi:phosphoribosylaminoimidazole carboxylase ATPase subunit [Citrobacter koseri]|uniref:Phosphoribosylaminoimidazole carboxylase ATPase subunit n=1 Tax=Citrobacter koseri TaxID=545 RepID=A0A3S4I9F1_CITKO|nr:phosphoribosylaminoimidazole carboxylase ATPase subunit [Citrobacter koseri]